MHTLFSNNTRKSKNIYLSLIVMYLCIVIFKQKHCSGNILLSMLYTHT